MREPRDAVHMTLHPSQHRRVQSEAGLRCGLLLTAEVKRARGQQPTRIPRIGILGLASGATAAPYLNAVRAGLRDLVYIEGKEPDHRLPLWRWQHKLLMVPY
jgi:hypothetical protein